ncbi:MAG: hypothetical protein AAF998_09350 [Bacteroidota bacterium]
MQVVSYEESYKATNAYITSYNQGFVRGLSKSGEALYDLRRILRKEHRQLMDRMLKLYARQLLDMDADLLLVRGNLPAFATNSVALGKVLGCNPRTIRNLIGRLLEAGVIAQKVYKGRKNNYRLIFSPACLVTHKGVFKTHDLQAIDRQLAATENQSLISDIRKHLPVFDTDTKRKKNNLQCGLVEKERTSPLRIDSTGNALNGQQGKQKPLNQQEDTGNQGPGGGAETPLGHDKGKQDGAGDNLDKGLDPAPSPAHLSDGPDDPGLDWTKLEDYYMRLFSLCMAVLYPKLEYMADSQAYHIKKYLALQFYNKPTEDYEAIYRQLYIRILIVEAYLKRDPKRFVPLPEWYFDPANAKGFAATEKWYENMGKSRAKMDQFKARYKVVMKAWGGFMQQIGRYIDDPSLDSYQQGRTVVSAKYGNLIRAYDYVILASLEKSEIGQA